MKKQEHRLKKKAMKAGKFVSLMLFLQQSRVVAQELQMGYFFGGRFSVGSSPGFSEILDSRDIICSEEK